MEENKELIEHTEAAAENTAQAGTVEFEDLPAVRESVPAAKTEKAEKTEGWGDKSVTRMFLVIALAVTLLLNAALTAGIAGAFLKKQTKDIQGLYGKGGPGSEMFSGKHNGKGMTPPGNDSGSAQSQSSGPSIGIVIRDDSGVYIAQVTGDNAKNAGFQEGDKVVSIDGKEVATGSDLVSEVKTHKAGDTVAVTVERDGQSIEIKTELE